jgi:hypothetical protein
MLKARELVVRELRAGGGASILDLRDAPAEAIEQEVRHFDLRRAA